MRMEAQPSLSALSTPALRRVLQQHAALSAVVPDQQTEVRGWYVRVKFWGPCLDMHNWLHYVCTAEASAVSLHACRRR